MNGKMLLDTNIVIGLFAQDEDIRTRLSQAEEVFIPSIVLGELYYGARNSSQVDANVVRIDQFARRNVILTCDAETSRFHEIFNHRSGTVIAMAITSQEQRAGFPLTWVLESGNLPKQSWVKISQIRTLSVERIGDQLGQAAPEEMDQIVEGLNEIIGP